MEVGIGGRNGEDCGVSSFSSLAVCLPGVSGARLRG